MHYEICFSPLDCLIHLHLTVVFVWSPISSHLNQPLPHHTVDTHQSMPSPITYKVHFVIISCMHVVGTQTHIIHAFTGV